MEFKYGADLAHTEEADSSLSRRTMLKQGAAAVVAGGTALIGGPAPGTRKSS